MTLLCDEGWRESEGVVGCCCPSDGSAVTPRTDGGVPQFMVYGGSLGVDSFPGLYDL